MATPGHFDEEHAARYDDRFVKLAPMRDALHLVTRLALSELPSGARILCVGAGTGAEMLHLAEAFPSWRFTAVEPSAPMLARCRDRAQAAGIASRCDFHEGYVDTLSADGFDGATSLLVSQFLVDKSERTAFFRAIAERLQSRAPLVVADLASPLPFGDLFELWKRAWLFADIPRDNVDKMADTYRDNVGVLPPDEVATIIAQGGFDAVQRVFQTILIHGWTARRAA